MPSAACFFDENNVRCRLHKTHAGDSINWLCFPGGPGCDADYFKTLLKDVELPGNTWLIDFPGNGTHEPDFRDYEQWFNHFMPLVERFSNPAIIGHSFGAMLPLYFPELENILHAFIVLNASPSIWLEKAQEIAKKRNLPDFTPDMEKFVENPCEETFTKALMACAPYYFQEKSLAEGKALLQQIPRNIHASAWYMKKIQTEGFDAQWIPQSVPTLIVGGEYDAITPYEIYKNDTRFDRNNIEKHLIEGAGHFPVIEKPAEFSAIISTFVSNLTKNHPTRE